MERVHDPSSGMSLERTLAVSNACSGCQGLHGWRLQQEEAGISADGQAVEPGLRASAIRCLGVLCVIAQGEVPRM
jgi:hypothetical protein